MVELKKELPEIFEEFAEQRKNSFLAIKEVKEKEIPVVGVFCTYQCEKDLFLVKGYGEQMSGGYSISVEELGWTSQAVFFRTMLLGPSDEKITISPPSYPYIVVKTEYRKEPVIFERFTEKSENDAI